MGTEKALSRRDFLRLSGATVGGAALLSACTASHSSAQSGPVTLKFWNSTYSTTDSSNKSKKVNQFYIAQAVQRFEAANPGIKIQMQVIPGTTDMFTQYRVASIAKNGPDVMTLWSGSYMLQMKNFLEPLDPYFTQQERARLRGWDAVTEGFQAGAGKTYGVPNASDGISAVYYNKHLLAKAGIDPEKDWPTTFDDFLTIAAKIKASGTTPFTLYDNGYTFFSLDYWIAQVVNGDHGILELVQGQRNFSESDLVAVAQKWSQLAQYTLPGAPTMNGGQAEQFFFQGKVAMTINGPWPIGDMRQALGDNLGMRRLPDFNKTVPIQNSGIGGAGTALIVSNYSKHKAEAVQFIKFLMSKEEQARRAADSSEGLINATDVDVSSIYKDPLRVQQQQWVLEPKTMFWPDNVYPAELTSELAAQAQLAWTGKITPLQFMQKLDAKRDSLRKNPGQ
ncbi:ABC transporter substrate-binding protein [Dictyobacter sp. S3.2.2.5]|uniref:ABC transporter substrate-binding protein n=1 Tax=Dictyobacter halimunensis TaxID=3026934 RepID=A0ABQ6FKU3_9CHLR|nr:ABC transporter substrate-binding protein [Dictyobacter sp. S3.2.2.5]